MITRSTATTHWRDHMTAEERALIEAGDAAKVEWEKLNERRAGIINRCVQRARYAASRREKHQP